MKVHLRNRLKWLILSVGCGLLLVALFWLMGGTTASVQAAPTDRYVSTVGIDVGGCTSIGNPCHTVQFAIDAANPGDRILVAQGTYTDVHSRNGYTQVAYISKTLTLLGGYTNTFTTRFPRSSNLFADRRGRPLVVNGSITVTVDGFALTSGDATTGGTGGFAGPANGGGVLFYGGTLKLADVSVFENEALASGAQGGGIYHEFGTLIIEDSFIGLNGADSDGSGLYSRSGEVHIRDGHFIHDGADEGGAINLETVTAWLTNTVFFENGADNVGGAMSVGGSYVHMWHPSLLFNTRPPGLGAQEAIFVSTDLYGQPSNLHMTNTLAVSHTVVVSAQAGPPALPNTAVINGVLWFGNQQNTTGPGIITVTNAYTGNPNITAPGFAIIGSGSAAINRGVPSPVSRDFFGDLRVGAPDLGADEYVLYIYVPVTLRNY
ncbi:MAG: hypothetical protein ACP5GX_01695 [Anaerolineae bacterium]